MTVARSTQSGYRPSAAGARRALDVLVGVSPAAGLVDTALGAIVLIGWSTGAGALTTFLPNEPPAKANAAALLVLAGVALLLWRSEGPTRHAIARGLGLAMVALAGATLLEYLTGANLGIDSLIPTADAPSPRNPFPGRMALHAAIGLLMAGLAIARLGASWRGRYQAELLGLAVALIGAFDLLAYVYGAPSITAVGMGTQVALPVALGLLVLGIGIIAARADHSLMRLVRDPDMTGRATRRILPVILLGVPVGSWLRMVATRATLMDPVLIEMVVDAAVVTLSFGVTWWAIIPARSAEQALGASEERYRTLVEQSSDAVFVLDAAGRVVEANTTSEQLLGYAPGALLGRGWDGLITPDDLAAQPLHFADLREGRTLRFERQLRHTDGAVVPVELSAKMLSDGRYLEIARDISERKEGEEERRRLTAAIDQSQDSVMLTDPERRIVYTNQAFESLSGYPIAELVGRRPEVIFGGSGIGEPADTHRRLLAGEAWAGDIEARGADGRAFTAEWSISPVHDQDGGLIGHVAIARDRSAERALEEQLRQSQKMEAVGQLAGGIAHDFNNLLTAIRGYSELVRERLPAEDEQNGADIDEVVSAADRAAALTSQLLAFSRRQVLQPRVLDPAEVVKDIAPMLRRLLGEHIRLTTRTAPRLGRVKVDPGQLEQVIVNLAVNAGDAMPDGGKLTIKLRNVELDPAYAATHLEAVPGPHVLLAISDTGSGMDEATRAHIFEPFFTTKELGKGTGLGLATVYGIVKQSNGSISLDSEPAHGTTFRIYLPRAFEEPTAAVAETLAARPSSSGRETILLVEDEAPVREFSRRALEAKGYTVLEAASGADALSIAASHVGPIALLVTDVIMPGLQGQQLAEQLMAARPELRTLCVSGFAENAVIRHGVAFLAKPFSVEALCGAVRDVLDRQA
jgi:PAS domain S-box-containing protein